MNISLWVIYECILYFIHHQCQHPIIQSIQVNPSTDLVIHNSAAWYWLSALHFELCVNVYHIIYHKSQVKSYVLCSDVCLYSFCFLIRSRPVFVSLVKFGFVMSSILNRTHQAGPAASPSKPLSKSPSAPYVMSWTQ